MKVYLINPYMRMDAENISSSAFKYNDRSRAVDLPADATSVNPFIWCDSSGQFYHEKNDDKELLKPEWKK